MSKYQNHRAVTHVARNIFASFFLHSFESKKYIVYTGYRRFLRNHLRYMQWNEVCSKYNSLLGQVLLLFYVKATKSRCLNCILFSCVHRGAWKNKGNILTHKRCSFTNLSGAPAVNVNWKLMLIMNVSSVSILPLLSTSFSSQHLHYSHSQACLHGISCLHICYAAPTKIRKITHRYCSYGNWSGPLTLKR